MKAVPRASGSGVVAPLPSNDGATETEMLPLSKSKLVPPRLPAHIVAADRHAQWIDPLLAHDVTLVIAPGDYGKSTLCANLYGHLTRLGHRCAWVSFDSDLSSMAAADYLIAALLQATGAPPATPPAGARWSASAEAVRLANEIQSLADEVILFLDDVDRIGDDRCAELLDQLLQQRCPNLHVVLAGAGRMPAFARRAEQRSLALRLDCDDLRLNDLEVAELLATSGLFLSDAQIVDLNTVMAGWVGGLKMVSSPLRQVMLESIHGNWEERCCGALGTAFDLALDQLPAEERALLLDCCVALELTPGLCVALTGAVDAADRLRHTAESGVLLHRQRCAMDHYRFHPAFRSFLLRRLEASDPVRQADLYRRASAWHAAQGLADEAITLALAGKDIEAATDLLADAAMSMIGRDGPIAAGAALDRLPAGAVAARPALRRALLWSKTLRADVRDDDATACTLSEAEEQAIATTRAFVKDDDVQSGLARAEAFLSDHGDTEDFPAHMVRAFAALAETQRGRHRVAGERLRPLSARMRGGHGGLPEAIAAFVSAAAHRAQGRPVDSERALQDVARLFDRPDGRRTPASALVAVAQARACYEQNDLASASCLVEGTMPLLDQAGIPDASLQAYLLSIRIAASLSRADEAVALIERAELRALERRWLPLKAMCAVERRRLHLPPILELEEIVPADREEDAVEHPLSAEARAFAILSEARAYEAIANDDRPRLTAISERLLRLSHTADDIGLRVKATLLNIVPQLSGRCSRMVEVETVKFLNLAASLGYIRTMVDILEVTGVHTSQDFCGAQYSAGSFLALLRLVQPSFGTSGLNGAEAVAGQAFSFLSAREIEIVNALHAGETNKVIARQIGLTPETVKWHLKNLMKKLRANSRGEVVRNAIMLGLSLPS